MSTRVRSGSGEAPGRRARAAAWGAVAAVVGLTLVGTAGPAAAQGTGVDLTVYLGEAGGQVAPGNTFDIDASVTPVDRKNDGTYHGTGELTLDLPDGVTFQKAMDSPDDCTPSADRHTVHCPMSSDYIGGGQFRLKVDKSVPDGTTLTYSATVHAPDVDDPNPANDTVTRTVLVKAGPDLSLHWEGPTTVHAGSKNVSTPLVVTNHGPGVASPGFVVTYDNVDGVAETANLQPECAPDIWEFECGLGPLQPGESAEIPFVWSFGPKSAGKTFHIQAGYPQFPSSDDPTPEDDTPLRTIRILPADATSTPKPTASATASASATSGTSGTSSPSGTSPDGSELADTGAGDSAGPLVLAASASVLLGGTLVLTRRVRAARAERTR
ncbi:MAG: hypothetical protein HOY69_34785 [Streptomyces sp.]|nr:hypothetical protein [Streptomyces sp.]